MQIKSTVASICETNSYMLSGDDYAFFIDVGEIDDTMIDFAYKNQKKPHKAILLTHCHFDHIGGVEKVKSFWNCDVIIGKNDADGLQNPQVNLSGLWTDNNISLIADRTVSDGDVFNIGPKEIRVIETPGHTVGGVCYIIDDLIFTGDTLFKGSIGRYDLPTSDYGALLNSLKKISKIKQNLKVYAGHGPTTTLEDERENNPYMREL